jgi:hypothetical protein
MMPIEPEAITPANAKLCYRFLYITYSGENTFGDFESA